MLRGQRTRRWNRILSYQLEEMLGTKLRALYQRKKGRDLFDIAISLKAFPKISKKTIVICFQKYMDHDSTSAMPSR